MGDRATENLKTIGNAALLQSRKVALLCSRSCPGSIIMPTLDVIRALRETPLTLVSGFQSPIEQECLELLIRAEHPVIVCPARSVVGMRLPAAWKLAVSAGRMLITSPFDENSKRTTTALAEERNRFVVSLADEVLVPHASPGGQLERLCREIAATGKPLWTLNDPANAPLFHLGAKPVSAESLPPIRLS